MSEPIKMRPQPECQGCKQTPNQISEYIEAAEECDISPDDYVREEEGTFNPANGHFLCTNCYIQAGMPATQGGWICP